MNYRHNFGSFQKSIRVDGFTYTSDVYQGLTHESRQALCAEATSRCVAASQRRTAAFSEAMAPHRDALKASLQALESLPRFARRYRGRAADIRSEEVKLRNEFSHKVREAQASREPSNGVTYPAAVSDVFRVWESQIETDYERFERLVTHHDWHYGYSDDHRVWSAGERSAKEIISLVQSLKDTEHGEAAQLLYNQKCPWLNEDGSQVEEED